jgi:hypothetical protein
VALAAVRPPISGTDVGQARKIINRHADLGISLAQA